MIRDKATRITKWILEVVPIQFFLEFFSWTVEQLTLIFLLPFFQRFFLLCRVYLFWLIKKRTNQFEANSSKSFSVFFSKNFTQENKFFDIFEFRIISMIYVLYFLTKILCKFLLIYDFSWKIIIVLRCFSNYFLMKM